MVVSVQNQQSTSIRIIDIFVCKDQIIVRGSGYEDDIICCVCGKFDDVDKDKIYVNILMMKQTYFHYTSFVFVLPSKPRLRLVPTVRKSKDNIYADILVVQYLKSKKILIF